MEVRTVVRHQHFVVEEVSVLGYSEIREDREIAGVVELANQIFDFDVRKRGLVMFDHLFSRDILHYNHIVFILEYLDDVVFHSNLLDRCFLWLFLHWLSFNHLLDLSSRSFLLFWFRLRLRSLLLSSLSGLVSFGLYGLSNFL